MGGVGQVGLVSAAQDYEFDYIVVLVVLDARRSRLSDSGEGSRTVNWAPSTGAKPG